MDMYDGPRYGSGGNFDEFDKAMDLYDVTFGESFPTIPLGRSKKAEEIIYKCVKANKDVYEMGYLQLDEDILY